MIDPNYPDAYPGIKWCLHKGIEDLKEQFNLCHDIVMTWYNSGNLTHKVKNLRSALTKNKIILG